MIVPPAPGRPARQRRHLTSTMLLAQTMYADGDSWTPTQIVDYLAAHGTVVSLNTVRLWVVPGAAEEHRDRQRKAYAARQRARAHTQHVVRKPRVERPQDESVTPLLDRMRQLREAGMNPASVAVLMRVDHGVELTADTVRYYLRTGREPRLPKQKAGVS